jgi:hypothetical protein
MLGSSVDFRFERAEAVQNQTASGTDELEAKS